MGLFRLHRICMEGRGRHGTESHLFVPVRTSTRRDLRPAQEPANPEGGTGDGSAHPRLLAALPDDRRAARLDDPEVDAQALRAELGGAHRYALGIHPEVRGEHMAMRGPTTLRSPAAITIPTRTGRALDQRGRHGHARQVLQQSTGKTAADLGGSRADHALASRRDGVPGKFPVRRHGDPSRGRIPRIGSSRAPARAAERGTKGLADIRFVGRGRAGLGGSCGSSPRELRRRSRICSIHSRALRRNAVSSASKSSLPSGCWPIQHSTAAGAAADSDTQNF